jgi:hypothetical protein
MTTTHERSEVPDAPEDLVPMTAEQAAHELAADGRSLEEARAIVRAYLDDTSVEIGVAVHQWALDAHDLREIDARDPLEIARDACAVLPAQVSVARELDATADHAARDHTAGDGDGAGHATGYAARETW